MNTVSETSEPQFRPLAVGIANAARMVGVSAATMKREIARGKLKACHVGRRVVVKVSDIELYLDRK